MNRRNTLKKLLTTTGGLVVLPAWANQWQGDKISINPAFNNVEQSILEAMVDTLIPAGDAIGGLSVGVDKFLQKLFADCYEKEIRDQIKEQLMALNKKSIAQAEKPFPDCSAENRILMLQALSESEDENEQTFFKLIKDETIRGFRTSKEVMTEYYDYVVAPGHYYGCVEINNTENG